MPLHKAAEERPVPQSGVVSWTSKCILKRSGIQLRTVKRHFSWKVPAPGEGKQRPVPAWGIGFVYNFLEEKRPSGCQGDSKGRTALFRLPSL